MENARLSVYSQINIMQQCINKHRAGTINCKYFHFTLKNVFWTFAEFFHVFKFYENIFKNSLISHHLMIQSSIAFNYFGLFLSIPELILKSCIVNSKSDILQKSFWQFVKIFAPSRSNIFTQFLFTGWLSAARDNS